MILLGLLGVLIGGISYYGFTMQKKDVDKTHKMSKKLIFKFLDPTERIIISHLLQNSNTTQSSLSKLDNIGKVKSHRTLQKLESKGIVTLENMGKTKKVILSPEIRKVVS